MNTTRILSAVLFGAAVLCLTVGQALAQPAGLNRSTISGYVFGPQRSPVGEVAVELRNEVNSVIGRTRTNSSGRFTFFGVPNGRLSVTVLPLGTNFEGQSQEIEIAGIGARGTAVPENAQIDFYLRLRKSVESTEQNEVVFAQEVPPEAKRLYQVSIADLDSKRASEGVSGLKRALEIFPTYFLALKRLGAEQIRLEKYEDAAKSFAAAVKVNERSFACWYGASYANFALQNWQRAIDAASRALELEKNSVNALVVVGIAQRSLKRYDEAEKALLRAKSIDKVQTPDIYWHLALLYTYNFKKFQEAADALELYLKANSSMPDAETKKIRTLIRQLRENRAPSE